MGDVPLDHGKPWFATQGGKIPLRFNQAVKTSVLLCKTLRGVPPLALSRRNLGLDSPWGYQKIALANCKCYFNEICLTASEILLRNVKYTCGV